MKLTNPEAAPKALADLLCYAALIDPGIVLCKDGSLLAGATFAGPDNAVLTDDERNGLSALMNDRLKGLGAGWSLQVDAVRRSAATYPAADGLAFDDPISRLIDAERRDLFESAGAHYETRHYALLNYLPPALAKTKLEQMVYSAREADTPATVADEVLNQFVKMFVEFTGKLAQTCRVNIMTSYETTTNGTTVVRDELVNYLNFCICGLWHEINLPKSVIFLDGLLGRYDFVSGLEPAINNQAIRVVSVDGYPGETYPGILSALDSLPLEYRWSNRFIYMDNEKAKVELNRYRRKWRQKERGFMDQLFGTAKSAVDGDAVQMVGETEAALADASSESVAFGYFSCTLVVTGEQETAVLHDCQALLNALRSHGCSGRLETINSTDAWLSTLPGHIYANVRRPLMHTLNLADLLPLSAMWPGAEYNPCDLYPQNSPALLYADTTGASIFRLNLHVADVGHTLVIGPTGAGKSTLLGLIAAQFKKYSNAQTYCFDKGGSMYCLTKAVGGDYYEIAEEDSELVFSPLAELATHEDTTWAEGWVADLCELQLNRALVPSEKGEIHAAVAAMAAEETGKRSLSGLSNQLQDLNLREAIKNYTLDGAMGHLLDGESDGLSMSSFACFELETLMNYDDKNKLPVLLYLFRRVEKALRGAPALIIIDEAWLMLAHPTFRGKIVEWLKVMRKQNAAVVMATQSLADAVRSGILDVILESTATRIFLPNPSATSTIALDAYQKIGLNHAEIETIAGAEPKCQYYVTSTAGDRLVDLKLGGITLSFVGQSGNAAKAKITTCIAEHGDQWPQAWLEQCGYAADAKRLGYPATTGDAT